MPLLKLHLPAGLEPAKVQKLVEACHRTLNQTFKLDPPKGQVAAYESAFRTNAAGRSKDWVYVEVSAWPGRTQEMKAALLENLSRDVQAHLGTPPEDIQVNFLEYDKRHWAASLKVQA